MNSPLLASPHKESECVSVCDFFSQSVSDFTVPPRAHPSTGSQSGSATPGLLTQRLYMYMYHPIDKPSTD